MPKTVQVVRRGVPTLYHFNVERLYLDKINLLDTYSFIVRLI
ncbi:hypothetical protein [Volucribacter amazonae]|nr:hypothetical protein [Volucribacter amazonae]